MPWRFAVVPGARLKRLALVARRSFSAGRNANIHLHLLLWTDWASLMDRFHCPYRDRRIAEPRWVGWSNHSPTPVGSALVMPMRRAILICRRRHAIPRLHIPWREELAVLAAAFGWRDWPSVVQRHPAQVFAGDGSSCAWRLFGHDGGCRACGAIRRYGRYFRGGDARHD